MVITRRILFMTAMCVSLLASNGYAQSNAAQMGQAAGNSQGGAQGAAIAMAAIMAAMCNQPQGNIAPCILSALAAMQAGSLGGTKQGAYGTASQLSTSGSGSQPGAPPYGDNGSGATISGIKQTLTGKGAVISDDGKTMTLPDGKTVALDSSAGTDAGQKAAGLTDKQIADGKAAIAEAQGKLGAAPKAGEMAGEGGSGGGGLAAAPVAAAGKPGKARGKKSLSGLSKNFGGDKIGVSADDIFEMITRRYKAKDAEETFIK